MRLVIDHRTQYRFSQPQKRIVQLLRMTPLDNGCQTVIDWRIDVDADAKMREGRDGYGNVTTMLYVDGPVDAINIMVRGEVLSDVVPGPIMGTVETLPPLFFTRTTPQTEPDIAIAALGRTTTPSGQRDQALELNAIIAAAVRPLAGRTPKGRTAAEVLESGEGSVRDCAHLMLAAARSVGFPARFVSGHCLDGPNAGSHKSSHCWTELYIEGAGWHGFDPSTGRVPNENYARVSIGLDASDSTPLSGTRRGGGIEELDVEVRVATDDEAL